MLPVRVLLFSFLLFHSTGLLAQQPRLVLPIGHSGSITDVSFSPNGKFIATASTDRTVKLWSTLTKKELITFSGHTDIVNALGFSPDNKYLATASEDSTAKLWSLTNGTFVTTFKGHRKTLKSVAFSPDSRFLLTSSEDSTVRIWNRQTGKSVLILKGFGNIVQSASYSPDGKCIITSSLDGKVKTWEAGTGKLITEINFGSGVSYSEFSPDGKYLLTLFTIHREIIVSNIKGEFVAAIRKAHKDWVNSAHFSPDSKSIITSSSDRSIKRWNVANGILTDSLVVEERCAEAAFNKDGKYIIGAVGNTIRVWESAGGKLSYTLRGRSHAYASARFSNDEKFIVTAAENGPVNIWSVAEGRLITTLQKRFSKTSCAVFSPDDKMILVCSYNEAPELWDAFSGVLIKKFQTPTTAAAASFSPDGKTILFLPPSSKTAKIVSANDGKEILEIKGHREDLWSAVFSPDGKNIATGSWDKTVKIWKTTDGTFIRELRGHQEIVASVNYSHDGKLIITASLDKTCKIWHVETGVLINTIITNNRWATPKEATFNADATTFSIRFITRFFFTEQVDPSTVVEIRNVSDGSLKYSLSGHTAAVSSSVFGRKNNLILTSSDDNTCKLWDSKTGKLQNTFFVLDSNDYFNQVTGGYYQCTPPAAKLLHYITRDLKLITFEQLDVKYNRPDKVLEAIGNTDTALIRSYRKAWEKRIKKLGIDTTQFRDGYSVPEADISNRDDIEAEQTKGMLALRIKGTDSAYQLDRFNIWVNETPLFGQRGISIKKKKANSIDTTITIQSSQGENRIETSVTNVNGTESYRMPLYVNYTPAIKQKEMIRFIGIGIDQFNEPKYNLQYSVKDIRDLARKLKEKYKEAIIIDTLFNEKVTTENVKLLKQKLLQTTVNDKVIISYSGHGLLSKEFDYFLSTYSVNFTTPEENGLPYDELENLLDSIPARKKLMLIDACHSGEVDKEDLVRLAETSDSLVKGFTPVAYKKEDKHLGLKNSFELMQSVFVNVGKSTGATIISAAAGTQFALERNDLKNGVFTYSILEAMKKYLSLKISELRKIVGERVEQLTRGLQKPTSRNEIIAADWSL